MAHEYQQILHERNHLFHQRAKAFAIDLVVAAILAVMMRTAFLDFMHANFSQFSTQFWQTLHRHFAQQSIIANYTIWIGYLGLSYYFTGTSLGKYFMNLKVVDHQDPAAPLALWQCFNRALCGPIYLITVIPCFFPLLNDAGYTLGDWLGQCHVVNVPEAHAAEKIAATKTSPPQAKGKEVA
ncbi:MAG: RDD family protein [Bacteriovoracaceae bacterium]|nr:RDD family protein [Bacteriovoracaceae bacterium]